MCLKQVFISASSFDANLFSSVVAIANYASKLAFFSDTKKEYNSTGWFQIEVYEQLDNNSHTKTRSARFNEHAAPRYINNNKIKLTRFTVSKKTKIVSRYRTKLLNKVIFISIPIRSALASDNEHRFLQLIKRRENEGNRKAIEFSLAKHTVVAAP